MSEAERLKKRLAHYLECLEFIKGDARELSEQLQLMIGEIDITISELENDVDDDEDGDEDD